MKSSFLLHTLSPQEFQELPEKMITFFSYVGDNSSSGEDRFRKETQSLPILHVWNMCAKTTPCTLLWSADCLEETLWFGLYLNAWTSIGETKDFLVKAQLGRRPTSNQFNCSEARAAWILFWAPYDGNLRVNLEHTRTAGLGCCWPRVQSLW